MNGYKKKTKMDEIHELGIQLRDEQLQNTHLAQKCSDLADELNKMEGRVNALEEWLTEYRDELKRKVYHKNEGLINDINELLDET